MVSAPTNPNPTSARVRRGRFSRPACGRMVSAPTNPIPTSARVRRGGRPRPPVSLPPRGRWPSASEVGGSKTRKLPQSRLRRDSSLKEGAHSYPTSSPHRRGELCSPAGVQRTPLRLLPPTVIAHSSLLITHFSSPLPPPFPLKIINIDRKPFPKMLKNAQFVVFVKK